MAEYSVLIADGSEEFCAALKEKLNRFCKVRTCTDGTEALELLCSGVPDVLVADLMLPKLDGISLMEVVRLSGWRMGLVATSGYVSPWILHKLESLGVSALLQQPCDLQTAADRVVALLLAGAEPAEADLWCWISCLLLQLGFSAKLRGYGYLREAVYQMVLNSDRSIVKELYASVGARFGVTGRHVEHSIRGAIADAWDRRDPQIWTQCFGQMPALRPTSAALIHTLTRNLRQFAAQSCGGKLPRSRTGA